jgi:outer membrane protein OmpA-like peptidoglycan-associated protein
MRNACMFALAGALGLLSVPAASQTSDATGYWRVPAQAWKNGFGECWRSGSWNAQMATPECDAALAARPAPTPAPRAFVAPPPPAPSPAPAPAPAPVAAAPAPAPAPVAAPAPAAKPAVITFGASDLFGFNSATLTPKARASLDQQVVSRVRSLKLNSVKVDGYTDHLGRDDYNQKLSERRAEAVKGYLASQGVEASKIQATGHGEANPVKTCTQKNRKALIDCLAPNRRVEVRIEGI